VTARGRIVGLVALASVAAVAVVAVAVVAADDSGSTPAAEAKPRPGRPPLSFALGFRTDPEARDLARGQALYTRGDLEAARAAFAGRDALEAKVGLAFASWPDGTLDRLEQLAKLYPESGVVQLHLGLARLWARQGDPIAAWQAVGEGEPDTPYAVLAGNLLFPKVPRGLPTFVPSLSLLQDTTPFFSQYAQSWSMWSPDGAAFAFPVDLPGSPNTILVQPSAPDARPYAIGHGTFVAWSPV